MRDEQRGDEGGGEQEAGHGHGRGGQQPLGPADPPGRPFTGVVHTSPDLRHHRHTGLEPGQSQRQLGEHDQRQRHGHHRVAMGGGETLPPVPDDGRLGGDAPQAGEDDGGVHGQESGHQDDSQAHDLPEPTQEDQYQTEDQDQRDAQLVTFQSLRSEGVLDQVRRGVRGREREGDHEVGDRKAQQDQDQQLAAPVGQQPLQHRDRALSMGGLPRHPAVHGQSGTQGDQHQHERGHRREQPGCQSRDGRLVAQRGEVVEAGQAHHLPPRMPLVRVRARTGPRAARSRLILHGIGQPPGPQSARVLGCSCTA
ncbi:hypothetical protein SAMN04487966_110139 [Micrococcus terreus]|uniref:Uncharacterized protein n=1 Tax=Micrococcus terreus TaxID=574650 RepID=A0A1I7MR19_9MICC|nr:hypothetical protein SAMN04487966_110139 [Micrococcus terreus]